MINILINSESDKTFDSRENVLRDKNNLQFSINRNKYLLITLLIILCSLVLIAVPIAVIDNDVVAEDG